MSRSFDVRRLLFGIGRRFSTDIPSHQQLVDKNQHLLVDTLSLVSGFKFLLL